ncbi:MAG TPA: DnaJ domain-containing protein [Nostocaceae cyanobacterium]|nr:DnaJ domain-containing protein [Nostocaceae cyanobacterium]
MDLGDYYRVLGLRSGASFAEIKASYRRLVQQYHPDTNPGDIKAKDKFIAVTEAYKFLQTVVTPEELTTKSQQTRINRDTQTEVKPSESVPKTRKTAVAAHPPRLEEIEQRLKWKTYEQLQRFLQAKRFPQAIALAEALVARLPADPEVRQWLAIACQMWGHTLISENQIPKAKIYLQKALKIDPYNKTLRNEIQRDLERL